MLKSMRPVNNVGFQNSKQHGVIVALRFPRENRVWLIPDTVAISGSTLHKRTSIKKAIEFELTAFETAEKYSKVTELELLT